MRRIAYFSMEIALESDMKTYSGGLGVLAGDLLYAAADLEVPMIGVSLLNRKGYLSQVLDAEGRQSEKPDIWQVEKFLTLQEPIVSVKLNSHVVCCRAWKYEILGITGYKVPVFFLDTELKENPEWERSLTDYLYGEDNYYRICQEIILGIGGVKMLRQLGYNKLQRYHMNEGHSAFLALELLDERLKELENPPISKEDVDAVRQKCVFTTHTPVAAGHDNFPMELVSKVLREREVLKMKDLYSFEGGLSMTLLALNLSGYINGVSKLNAEIDQITYAQYKIDAITNGVHAARWVCPSFQALFNQYIPGWEKDNFCLRYALGVPKNEIWNAHMIAKQELLRLVKQKTGVEMHPNIFTIGFARRAAAYKRGDLLFQDLQRLKDIASNSGSFQVVFAGKAHPKDQEGKKIIEHIFHFIQQLKNDIKIVYLSNYDMEIAKIITSGVDLWLNTPQPPLEASGTSGMKAALNGVPSLSILDGWWNEGYIEGATGWAIGKKIVPGTGLNRSEDGNSLYDKLEKEILPLYYQNREQYISRMLHCIALNGSFFHAQRMVLQYDLRAYSSI